jgi:hypothetical protein
MSLILLMNNSNTFDLVKQRFPAWFWQLKQARKRLFYQNSLFNSITD